MRLIDRYIIRNFLLNYVLAFTVLIGMYIVLDLIINFDRFTKAAGPDTQFFGLMADIGDFYFYRLLVIFQMVSAAIPLLAAGFTMVRMTRHNELTAMLASGVSLHRIAAPILACAVMFSLLEIVDQEILMPGCVDKLLRQHDEVNRPPTRSDPLYFVRDNGDNSLLVASLYEPGSPGHAPHMKDVRIILRDKDSGAPIGRIMAADAVWDPQHEQMRGSGYYGAWKLTDAHIIDDRPGVDPNTKVAEQHAEVFRNTRLTPEQLDLVFSKKAVDYLSTVQLQALIADSPDSTRTTLEKMMHIRFTQPLMNLVMLLLGIPFLLTREPRQLIRNMIYCTVVSTVCFVATFVIFQAAGTALQPLWGAWLPVLIFGPLALAMLDSIKT
jgi:lipopolysaccharide export system permease protein